MLALCVAITFGALTTGCRSIVQGAAVKSASSVPVDDVPSLDESALDGLMLSNGDLDKIAGVELESFYSTEEMNDNADVVSNVDCLGAIYPGEDAYYDGSGWRRFATSCCWRRTARPTHTSSSRRSCCSTPRRCRRVLRQVEGHLARVCKDRRHHG